MSARWRLAVAALIAAAVVVGGVVMERRLEVGPGGAAPLPPGTTGAWYCPHGGGEGWRAWVVVANPTDAAAQIAVTSRAGVGPPQVVRSMVAAGTHAYLEVPASQMASAAVVEFFTARVAAGMVVARPDGEGGVAAEPCAAGPASQWFIPEASTLRGQESHLVVHNPFSSEAVVDVSLITSKGAIRHGRLQGLVLAPGQVNAIEMGRFALDEPGMAAVVTAPLGRVAVAGVNVSTGGVRSVVGTPAGASGWVLPGTGGPGRGRLVVAAPEGEAAFRADAQGPEGLTPMVDLESVRAGFAMAFDVPEGSGGILVDGEGERPMLAGRMLAPPTPREPAGERRRREDRGSGGKRKDRGRTEEPQAPQPADLAATGGASAAGARWMALPAVPPEGGPAALVIQNPGGTVAEVTVVLLGPTGPEGTPQRVEVPPATAIRLDLPPTPVAALVEAVGGEVVPAQVSLDRRIHAVAVAVPLGRSED